MDKSKLEIAVFGGGCFWCTEAIFQRLRGVMSVAPGYAGGDVPNPTYEQVCTGATGHAEVARIEFDPQIISYSDLSEIFFATHDPTTKNQQGNDYGPQYRSVVFYTSDAQKAAAQKSLPKNAVTEILPLDKFYPAENYHQNYFNSHKDAPYCQLVIAPKIRKLLDHYGRLIT